MTLPVFPWTLYKAIEAPTGQMVVIDPRYLGETSRVVRSASEYDDAKRDGWHDSPTDAMTALELHQADAFQALAERAHDDQRMSDKAKDEADAHDRSTGFKPVVDVADTRKKGHAKKGD
jgi:hypothetical protein